MAKFEFVRSLGNGGQAPAIEEFPVAASQTLVIGDLVYLSSGQVTICGASSSTVLGLMAEDTDGADAGTLVKVQVAQPGYLYKATADADATSHVLAAKTYDINATTQTVDVGDASNGCIIIKELGDSTTDVRIMFTEFDLGCVN